MRWIAAARERWRALFFGPKADAEMDEELRFHLEKETELLREAGLDPREARRQALLRFGGTERCKEEVRDARGLRVFDEIGRDVRIGVRTLLRRPAFAVSVILTLAVGIGANVAVFSVVHAVLIRPFRYPAHEPDRVLLIAERSPTGERYGVSYPTFLDWVRQLDAFDQLSGAIEFPFTLTGAGDPVRVQSLRTSSTYFEIHGLHPLHGRVYDTQDDQFGAPPVVVLSHALWQARFGARPGVVGERARLDGVEYTVIGVLPPGVDLTPGIEVYTPLGLTLGNETDGEARGRHRPMFVHGRLAAGVSVEQARAELTAIAARFETQYGDTNAGVGVIVDRLSEWRLRRYRPMLWAIQAAVLVLWLIACTNVANLMLARTVTRRRQYAIIAALGAGPLRLLRPLLLESLILGLAATGVGLFAGLGLAQALRVMTPFDVPRFADAQLNAPTLALGLGLAAVSGMVAGLVPALRVVRRVDVAAVFNGYGRAPSGGGRFHRGLLVTEVALATLLLVGAGALVRTVVELAHVDRGFRVDGVLTARLLLIGAEDRRGTEAVFREVRRRVETLPEVVSAGLAESLPLLGLGRVDVFTVADQPEPSRADLPTHAFTPTDAGYFETLAIPLLEGRYIDDDDRRETPPVVVVTETLARRVWPGESALGKRMHIGPPEIAGPWREVVGVVGDLRPSVDAEVRSVTFIPLEQFPIFGFMALVARTSSDPLSVFEPVRDAIRAAHPDLVVYDILSMDDIVAEQMAPRRFVMWALGLFGLIAIFIAAVGIYSILAHAVAQRGHELGIRMALGADRRDLRGLVLREGVVTALVGVLVGSAGSVAALRLLESLLLPQTTNDPWLWILVPLFVMAVALVSSFIPARRAARTDPIVALRGV